MSVFFAALKAREQEEKAAKAAKKVRTLPSISAFPKGPGLWRIDWLGDISFPDRTSRSTQPSVFVHLSQFTEKEHDQGFWAQQTLRTSLQRRVWVSIGVLPLLRVGDIWSDGKLVDQPEYKIETFPDLEINKENTTLIKAGLKLEERGYLLPLPEHPWHWQCTRNVSMTLQHPAS